MFKFVSKYIGVKTPETIEDVILQNGFIFIISGVYINNENFMEINLIDNKIRMIDEDDNICFIVNFNITPFVLENLIKAATKSKIVKTL